MAQIRRRLSSTYFFNCGSSTLLAAMLTLILTACGNPLGSSSNSQTGFLSGFSNLTDNNSIFFNAGSSTGSAVLWDSTNSYMRLEHTSDSGGANASDLELNQDWTPAWSNLISYWKFNETSGTSFADSSSGATNLAAAQGGVSSGVAGKLNHGATLNGSSGYISTANSYTNPNVFTLSVWFKTTTVSGGRILGFSGSQTGASWVYDRHLYMTNSGTLIFGVIPSGVQVVTSTLSYNDGLWHHAAATMSSAGISLYVDGAFIGTNTNGTSSTNFTGYWKVGYDNIAGSGWPSPPSSSYFAGTVDDVAIWDTALSGAAIQNIYQHESANYAGTFQSRIMDGVLSQSWTHFAWASTLPFYKELPDANASNAVQNEFSSSYSAFMGDTPAIGDNNLMSGIVGLWHLDEAAGAASILDRSGNNNNGSPLGGATLGSNGKLGGSFLGNGSNAYIGIPNSATNSDLTIGTQVSIAAWVKRNGSFGSWQSIVGKGASPPSGSFNIRNFSMGFSATAGAVVANSVNFQYYQNGTSNADIFSTAATYTDNNWHHVVFTATIGTPNSAVLYVDGLPKTAAWNFGTGADLPAITGGEFDIGANSDGEFFNGQIDEVGIWHKVLNSTEVLQLYRRGVNRIKYQLRSCSDAVCSANPTWVGPDNTNQTYFSELNNNLLPNNGSDPAAGNFVLPGLPNLSLAKFTSLVLPANRYFQYRAIMESDDAGSGCNYGSGATWCSPELQSVMVSP